MFMPDYDSNNNNSLLDNINKLTGTGLNVVSLINGIRGIGTNNPYYYQQPIFNMNMPQGQQFPAQTSQQLSPLFNRSMNGGFNGNPLQNNFLA